MSVIHISTRGGFNKKNRHYVLSHFDSEKSFEKRRVLCWVRAGPDGAQQVCTVIVHTTELRRFQKFESLVRAKIVDVLVNPERTRVKAVSSTEHGRNRVIGRRRYRAVTNVLAATRQSFLCVTVFDKRRIRSRHGRSFQRLCESTSRTERRYRQFFDKGRSADESTRKNLGKHITPKPTPVVTLSC